jgi:hypothetical protein
MMSDDLQALRREFDALLSRGGLTVPPDRYEGCLQNYAEMRRLAHLLRGRLAADQEPANAFRLWTVVRLSTPLP